MQEYYQVHLGALKIYIYTLHGVKIEDKQIFMRRRSLYIPKAGAQSAAVLVAFEDKRVACVVKIRDRRRDREVAFGSAGRASKGQWVLSTTDMVQVPHATRSRLRRLQSTSRRV